MRARLPLLGSLLATAWLAIAGAGPALADSTTSSNWAGYAAHRPGVKFTRVFGTWTQPGASCTAGRRTYSAMWVGLGGYRASSNALEQVGTEVDCTASGRVESTAWFELIPAVSKPISMTVSPGDTVTAGVTVHGHTITVALVDVTSRRSFKRTLHAHDIDVSSAEWILEAPSDCTSATACRTLPLTNFGSATFGLAKAETTRGHLGTIADRAWQTTRIRLTPGARQLVSLDASGSAGAATPSALTLKGTSFSVRFSTLSGQGNRFLSTRRAIPRAGHLVHPTLS
ncbi:MAG: G1 family endopeptidase [Actinomycetota bacterium]|nr:G1 family endopeptidase [Actinomycetota bacterium]